jgi:peptidoglycan/xylan/chitin deacetylase (PgdA/CDA1 family)
MFLGPISACGTISRPGGHEIMPHGYRHANKQSLPFAESKDLILRCLDVFDKELKGFDAKHVRRPSTVRSRNYWGRNPLCLLSATSAIHGSCPAFLAPTL